MEKELSALFKANHGYLLSGRSASRALRYSLKKHVENGDMVKTK